MLSCKQKTSAQYYILLVDFRCFLFVSWNISVGFLLLFCGILLCRSHFHTIAGCWEFAFNLFFIYFFVVVTFEVVVMISGSIVFLLKKDFVFVLSMNRLSRVPHWVLKN